MNIYPKFSHHNLLFLLTTYVTIHYGAYAVRNVQMDRKSTAITILHTCHWSHAHDVRCAEMYNREQRSLEMTSMNLQLPNHLFVNLFIYIICQNDRVAPKGCIKKTKEWPKWQHHFEQYQVASGLAGREEVSQVSTFLYCLGEDAEDIPDATRISTDDKTKYGKEVEAFNNYFKMAKKIFLRGPISTRKTNYPINQRSNLLL